MVACFYLDELGPEQRSFKAALKAGCESARRACQYPTAGEDGGTSELSALPLNEKELEKSWKLLLKHDNKRKGED